ncbi:glycosyltransferase [Polynucleobacter sp. es-GGE-1]|uniref:glycosyltransferase n=1 Tax=Polynucleobacter sp. es-GGE-1 TaxID=1819724 RepID=UPI001C0C0584|nr:glycosyltransferase [Polynucleobacter sp. es-GGE-1]MBU3635553.1 glycosyltransferase [Polynucleobacter sp. es-GGE-1]
MRLIFFAPNVHEGGGAILMRSLLNTLPKGVISRSFMDKRIINSLESKELSIINWVKPNIFSRIYAELLLLWHSRNESIIFCFGGIPPLFAYKSKIIIFQQNRNLLGLNSLSEFKRRVALRIFAERVICKFLNYKVNLYIVQTESMKRELIRWGASQKILVAPFRDLLEVEKIERDLVKWDYLYVADGSGHKNHKRLIEAWSLLAKDGLRPTLALTIEFSNRDLIALVDNYRARFGLKIVNLGKVPNSQMYPIYRRSGALVYPSTSESFGLPLLEASQVGLPIVASEMDFVRDVCNPVHSFDPYSSISIARAIKRHMGLSVEHSTPLTPKEFLSVLVEVVGNGDQS